MKQLPITKKALLRLTLGQVDWHENLEVIKEKENCDLCLIRLENFSLFVDGATEWSPLTEGKWADMCWICFKEHGQGLGTGLGQVYRTREPFNQIIMNRKGAE